jgi:hypothetical protein
MHGFKRWVRQAFRLTALAVGEAIIAAATPRSSLSRPMKNRARDRRVASRIARVLGVRTAIILEWDARAGAEDARLVDVRILTPRGWRRLDRYAWDEIAEAGVCVWPYPLAAATWGPPS